MTNILQPKLTAYRTGPSQGVRLIESPIERDWMKQTHDSFANRCLPLLVANQSGWSILSGQKIEFWWTGFSRTSDLRVRLLDGEGPCLAESHFGYGILTWKIPFLFETSEGFNILARGPANNPKDGISPLEGIIETDWSSATFTMNWKVTRKFKRIGFDIGEPICMLVPQKRGELQAFSPSIKDITEQPELAKKYNAWASSRAKFNLDLTTKKHGPFWQRDYFRGKHVESALGFREHQRKLNLGSFNDD
jgi:hypothetical protein